MEGVRRQEGSGRFNIEYQQEAAEEEAEVSEENYAQFFGTLTRTAIYKDHVGALVFNKVYFSLSLFPLSLFSFLPTTIHFI